MDAGEADDGWRGHANGSPRRDLRDALRAEAGVHKERAEALTLMTRELVGRGLDGFAATISTLSGLHVMQALEQQANAAALDNEHEAHEQVLDAASELRPRKEQRHG